MDNKVLTALGNVKGAILEKRKQILAQRRETVTKDLKNRMWIELLECKPTPDELILVSLADGTVECAIYNGLTWCHPYDNKRGYEDVIAWQPLPDPYVAEEIEDEE